MALLLWALCLGGEALRTTKPLRPALRLSFSALMEDKSKVTADETELMIMIEEPHNATPGDRMLLDVGKNLRHEHQRFFNETVCYTFDLFPDEGLMTPQVRFRRPRRSANSSDGHRMIFLGAMSEIFQAPLQLYDQSVAEGSTTVATLNCSKWRAGESRSMRVGELLQGPPLPTWWSQEWAQEPAVRELEMGGLATISAVFDFCVTARGELLATKSLYKLTYKRPANGTETNGSREPRELVIFERQGGRRLKEAPARPRSMERKVEGCVDLTQGSVGQSELETRVNAPGRLQRINREAWGYWEATEYDFWEDAKVKEIIGSLGTEMSRLKLPLRLEAPSLLRRPVPLSFDARSRWSDCNSIGLIRNQGACGSCWAVAAATVMTDRFCVAAAEQFGTGGRLQLNQESQLGDSTRLADLQGLSLAPELMVQCDGSNHGCGGGRLDDAWIFLQGHGIPKESCAPYKHCPVPTQRSCEYGWKHRPFIPRAEDICAGRCADGSKMEFYKVTQAYAAARPRDVATLQRELMEHGPVEVSFYVFSDFISYRSGVYVRTPGAYGPLGGHAVRLLGWGAEEQKDKGPVDYWLLANSYSPLWGMHGLFRMRRGVNECGIESTPAAGIPDLKTYFA